MCAGGPQLLARGHSHFLYPQTPCVVFFGATRVLTATASNHWPLLWFHSAKADCRAPPSALRQPADSSFPPLAPPNERPLHMCMALAAGRLPRADAHLRICPSTHPDRRPLTPIHSFHAPPRPPHRTLLPSSSKNGEGQPEDPRRGRRRRAGHAGGGARGRGGLCQEGQGGRCVWLGCSVWPRAGSGTGLVAGWRIRRVSLPGLSKRPGDGPCPTSHGVLMG